MTTTKNTSSNLSKTVKKNSLKGEKIRKKFKDKPSEVTVNERSRLYINLAFIFYSIFCILRIVLIIIL